MNESKINERLRIEQVVRPASTLAGIQTIDGTYVHGDKLGVGIVREVASDNRLLVHWVVADVDTWVLPNEVERLGLSSRVIAVYERDGHESREFKRYEVVARAGLDHDWAVEVLPGDVVRAVRSDGSAWTFDWYPLYERVYPIHTLRQEPPTDEDAEALTAAEIALTS